MSHTLARKLQLLHDSLKTTLSQIQHLQSLPPASTDSDRLDLANDIHASLKEHEDTLELLRQELDDDAPPATRRTAASAAQVENERNADQIARLQEDLRSARAKFRRAQLQAKRSADNAKLKEREALFKRNNAADESGSTPTPHSRRPGQERLTKEDIERNAAEDVTRALRRTHNAMTANIGQSQATQQALDETQEMLKGLAETYGGTGDMLKNSRALVGSLVRSNKSDTWYLQTSFYLMVVTIAWLVFRRLLYGPLWWLVWLPIKLLWSLMAVGMGAVAGGGGALTNGTLSHASVPTSIPGQQVTVDIGSIFGGKRGEDAAKHADAPPHVEEVGRMAEAAADGETNVNDTPEEERQRQEEMPRNPKKRMMEVDMEADRRRDEL
ncbi:uncharacterized protein AB675_8908 [Cyphellophora attinorum]|uniref:Sec20 C-terminal domain-containing protein n=1 Tax=Cyphellophora attinorum TaxID=1664694 RepID=A0A0N1H3H4_9EURO|nr:uncharacterized protein AB675_8908 [Phialophora attinorum]KPI36137.1 hypothetical protein AB675_8908 [Phialophora attinorum]